MSEIQRLCKNLRRLKGLPGNIIYDRTEKLVFWEHTLPEPMIENGDDLLSIIQRNAREIIERRLPEEWQIGSVEGDEQYICMSIIKRKKVEINKVSYEDVKKAKKKYAERLKKMNEIDQLPVVYIN